MIGWKKAKSSKDPHVPLKQLEKQLLELNKLVEKRAPQNERIKGTRKQKDQWWRDHNKVPYSVLQRRAGRLATIVRNRSKTAASRRAWNGKPW